MRWALLSGEGRHMVEDDGELRPLLLSLLRRSGFRATGARNGMEMRAVLEGGPVDLVLLDAMLPGRSGFELGRSRLVAARGATKPAGRVGAASALGVRPDKTAYGPVRKGAAAGRSPARPGLLAPGVGCAIRGRTPV